MSPERWQQVDRVFADALERPPAELSAFLEVACGGDPELGREVRELLAADREPQRLDDPLDRSEVAGWLAEAAVFEEDRRVGVRRHLLGSTSMRGANGDVTGLLREWSHGDPAALDRLIPLVFAQVRDLAARALAHESPEHTLQPTALVNEVYLRLSGCRTVTWRNRQQFFGFLADLMRRILVDHARRHRAAKRGGAAEVVSLDEIAELADTRSPDLLALHDALVTLETIDERQCRIVELKFFMGLKNEEAAQVLDVSVKTVERQWRAAKAWLLGELSAAGPPEGEENR